MRRRVMAKQHRNIDPHAQAMQPSTAAVDQFMRVRIADLAEPETCSKEDPYLANWFKVLCGQCPNDKRHQDQVRNRQQSRQEIIKTNVSCWAFAFNQPIKQACHGGQINHCCSDPETAPNRTAGDQNRRGERGNGKL